MEHQARSIASGTSIEFIVGDLIEERMDAYIVPFGDPTGTASRVQHYIRRMARAELGEEIARQIAALSGKKLHAGDSIVTRAPGLHCKYLIHCHFSGAPSTSNSGGLESALRSALSKCEPLGIQSVAMPALGTGTYGLPLVEVARMSVHLALTVQANYPGLKRIRFVLNSHRTLEAFLLARSDFRG